MRSYQSFEDLPDWVQRGVCKMRTDPAAWVHRPVPALDNESLLQVMCKGPGGEAKVRDYLERVMDRFYSTSIEQLSTQVVTISPMVTPATVHPAIDAMGDDLGGMIARQFPTICGAILRGPGVTSLREFTRIVTGEPHPFGNFAIFANPTDVAVQLAVEPLASLEVPSALIFAAAPSDNGLAFVKERGFVLAHEMPAMGVDIEALPGQELPAGYAFEEIDAASDAAWCDAFAAGYEIPRNVAQVFGPVAGAASEEAGSLRYFAIRKDNQIVTTSLLFLEGGLAGIYCVSTVAAERRKGLGAYATAEPLRRAREQGYRTGILQSSEMGEGVYKGLGFKRFGGLPLYVRMPS